VVTEGSLTAQSNLTVVKSAAPRTVLRGEGRVVKVYRDVTFGDRLRRLFGRSPAAREAANLRQARELDLPVPEILEDVQPADGEETIVLREIPGARALDEIALAGDLAPRRRRTLTVALAGLIRRLLDAGLAHDDLHAGNVLVDETDSLWLIDLHRARFRPALSERERRNALLSLGRFFLLHGTRADRLRFLRAFDPETWRESARPLESALRDSCEAFWKRRLARRYTRSRHVRWVEHGDFHGIVLTSFEGVPAVVAPDERERVIKSGRSSQVALRDVAGERVVLKRHRRKKILAPLLDVFRGSRARRGFYAGHALLMRGLDTAEPLAWLERTVAPGLPVESLAVTRYAHGPAGLEAFRDVAPDRRRERVRAIGRAVRRLHDAGFSHRDLKLDNWIWPDDGTRPVLLDLDGLRHRRAEPERVGRHLERLDRDLAEAGVSRTDRMRVVREAIGPAATDVRRRVLDGLAAKAREARGRP